MLFVYKPRFYCIYCILGCIPYDTSILNSEGGIGKTLTKMEMIWAPRLFPDGDCRDAANAMYDYVTNITDEQTSYDPN